MILLQSILLEMKDFYQTLLTNIPQPDHNECFEKVRQPLTIPPDHVIKMEKGITEQEILKVVKSLPNDKTPGEDGLPSEFYEVFWIGIEGLLLNAYRYSFENGQLSVRQKQGLLCWTPTKPDPLLLKNWRPLTWLNQDYKILANWYQNE